MTSLYLVVILIEISIGGLGLIPLAGIVCCFLSSSSASPSPTSNLPGEIHTHKAKNDHVCTILITGPVQSQAVLNELNCN